MYTFTAVHDAQCGPTRWKPGATAAGHHVQFFKAVRVSLFLCSHVTSEIEINVSGLPLEPPRYIHVESITNVTVIFPHPPSNRRRKECESWSAPLGSDSGPVGGIERRLPGGGVGVGQAGIPLKR